MAVSEATSSIRIDVDGLSDFRKVTMVEPFWCMLPYSIPTHVVFVFLEIPWFQNKFALSLFGYVC